VLSVLWLLSPQSAARDEAVCHGAVGVQVMPDLHVKDVNNELGSGVVGGRKKRSLASTKYQ
jgi:hypothetical protein